MLGLALGVVARDVDVVVVVVVALLEGVARTCWVEALGVLPTAVVV